MLLFYTLSAAFTRGTRVGEGNIVVGAADFRCCAALLYSRVPSLALRAIHLVPRLRRVADLCSSTVSEMRICGYNAEEKILCRTPFPAYAVYHLHPR